MSNKSKSHIRYRNSKNDIVPGVTTIIGGNLGWNTNILMAWARREALSGNDPTKVRDSAADIGICAHYMCECDAKGIEPDLSEYSKATIGVAENCYLGYLEWKNLHKINKVTSEIQLVSENYQYGGTVDMLYKTNDKLVLGDIKTANNIYLEHKVQLAAYHYLLIERGHKIDEVYILHLAKNGDFTSYKVKNLDKLFQVFQNCLALHKLHKELS